MSNRLLTPKIDFQPKQDGGGRHLGFRKNDVTFKPFNQLSQNLNWVFII